MSKDNKPCKFWEDELERLDGQNVTIITSGGTFAGQLAFEDEGCIVRLAPSAPGLFPATISVPEIEVISDLSSLNSDDFEAFLQSLEGSGFLRNFFPPSTTLFF
ncbi:hypothetical protein [Metabacillus sp. cB07]|uniref:hypothetical protein n=1 Tax=Metabacillus sp. cB07 TaxID=2806989 RepID=UPI00193932B6|nr:hypothetical protein [Metabacillus sp. cB07]